MFQALGTQDFIPNDVTERRANNFLFGKMQLLSF